MKLIDFNTKEVVAFPLVLIFWAVMIAIGVVFLPPTEFFLDQIVRELAMLFFSGLMMVGIFGCLM